MYVLNSAAKVIHYLRVSALRFNNIVSEQYYLGVVNVMRDRDEIFDNATLAQN